MKGITIQLVVREQTGVDEFNAPVFSETVEEVGDVLVGEPSTDEVTNTLNLTGKKVEYVLAIPKGDTHVWENTEILLPAPFDGRYRTIGFPTAGIEENIPLRWNKKVKVERYG